MASFGVSQLDAERRRLERRRALVDILQKQAMAGPEAPTMPGAQMSPYQGLAKMGEALIAALANRAQEKREQAFAGKEKEEAKNQAQSVVDYLMPSEFKPPAVGEQLSPTVTSAIPSQLNLTTPMRPIPQNVQQAQMANAIVTPQVPEPVAPPAPPSQEPQASPYTRNMASALANYAQNQGQRQAFTNALATGGPLAGVMMQDIMNKRKLQSEYEQQKRIKELSPDYEVLGQGQQLINPKTGEVVARNVAPVKPVSLFAEPTIKDYTPESIAKYLKTENPADLVPRKPEEKPSATARPMTQQEVDAYNTANRAVILNAGGTEKDVQNFTLKAGQPISAADDMRSSIGQWVGGAQAKATRAFANANKESKADSTTRTSVFNAYSPAIDSAERFGLMADAAEKAKKGDQQAGLALLSNHLGMTAGLQKGMRITKGMYEEAINSRPWLQGAAAKFSSDGYLGGVALSSKQIDEMLNNAEDRFRGDVQSGISKHHYWDPKNEVAPPERLPSKSVIQYYLNTYKSIAKKKMIEDGWSVQ